MPSRTFLSSSFVTDVFRQVLHLKSTILSNLLFSPIRCSCTQQAQWLQKMEFEPTSIQQTPHGCFSEVKIGPQFMSLIITLVLTRFTLSPLCSIQCVHAAYQVSNSFKLSTIITKSSTYIQGTSTFSWKGFLNNNEQQRTQNRTLIYPYLQHQNCLPQCCLFWSHCCYSYTLSSQPLLTIHWHNSS